MLKKQNRLKEKKDFNEIFKKGRSRFSGLLGVKTLKNNLEINRFGVIVSSKISKKAVERNKIKKQIKDVLRKENVKIKKGADFVVIALPEIKSKKFEDIKKDIINNLNSLNVY